MSPLAALAAALAPLHSAASKAAHAAQWAGGTYHHQRGVCAAVNGHDLRPVRDPYWPLHAASHYAWHAEDPRHGWGNGHLMVAPADRSEPLGPAAFDIPAEVAS